MKRKNLWQLQGTGNSNAFFTELKKQHPKTQQSLQELPFNQEDADQTNYCKIKPKTTQSFIQLQAGIKSYDLTKTRHDEI